MEHHHLLISIFENQAQSITLREAALRSCIQACVQINNATPSAPASELACRLIDAAYTEKDTSLVALALQADWFLMQNEVLTDRRLSALQQRVEETLTATDTTDDTLLACLAILKAPINHNVVSNKALFEFYRKQRSETIKATILTFFAEKADPASEAWLSQQTASSPKLEQLQMAAIEALSADAERLDSQN
jgi:hypothetical protein